MSIFYFEMRKNFFKISIIVCLILLSGVNIYKIIDTSRIYGQFSGNEMQKVEEAYRKIYNESLHGTIDQEKIAFIMSEYADLEQEVNGFNFSTNYDEERLTGYVYGDYGLFKFYIIPELEYAYMYTKNIDKVLKLASENVDFYEEINSSFAVKDNQKILNLYSDRKVDNYIHTEGWERFFCYEFSSFLIMLILILGLSPVFTRDRDTNMKVLLNTTKYGGLKTVIAKLASSIVFISSVVIYFFVFDLIVNYLIYEMNGLLSPVYSVEYFKFTPLNVNILGFIIISLFLKLISCLAVGTLMIILSFMIKNTVASITANTVLICLLIWLSEVLPKNVFNPINVMAGHKLLNEYRTYNFCGTPVLSFIVDIFIMVVVLIALISFAVTWNLKKRYRTGEYKT